jgi:hypothetical protein
MLDLAGMEKMHYRPARLLYPPTPPARREQALERDVTSTSSYLRPRLGSTAGAPALAPFLALPFFGRNDLRERRRQAHVSWWLVGTRAAGLRSTCKHSAQGGQ